MYLKCVVDPHEARPQGVPTSVGGYPGRTACQKAIRKGTFSVGNAGLGFISSTPCPPPTTSSGATGPYGNADGIMWSENTFAGVALPMQSQVRPAGVSGASLWEASPYTTSTTNNEDMSYRVVGHTIKVFPRSSFSNQNGVIHMLEVPNHSVLNLTSFPISAATVAGFEQTRTLRATQTGSQRDQIVLNWHPRSGPGLGLSGFSFNDLQFKGIGEAGAGTFNTVGIPINGLLIVVEGDPGTQFEFEVCTIFEMRGTRVFGAIPRLVDDRGMNLIFNAFSAKVESGYVGEPTHVEQGYLAGIWSKAKQLAGWAWKNKESILSTAASVGKTIAGIL